MSSPIGFNPLTNPLAVSSLPMLVMRADSRVVAVPIQHVTELMRPLPVEPLAGAPPFVLGLAIIRGTATPVIDLAALLADGAATAPQNTGRFVTLRVGHRSVALSVEAVLAIRALPRAELESLPPLWQGPHAPAVAVLGALDRELLIVLETTRLLPDDWHQSASTGAAL